MKKINFLLFFASFLSFSSFATTTGSARLINVDGIVEGQTGAANGSNGSNWESNEIFPGYAGVDWYLTWDNTNLYIGRTGGNNSQGSLIYIRQNKSATSNQAVAYDNWNPDFTQMGGLNFVAYLKSSYDEFRTYDGTSWSTGNTSLNPVFTQQSSANMEVTIAWNDITGGQGKPDNISAVMYIIDAAGCNGNGFFYGESPAGQAGTSGVAVNQPGGCQASNAAINRWWGCYPVIEGVSSLGYTNVPANAGLDAVACGANFTLAADANPPLIGTWSVISQPAGNNASFSNVNDSGAVLQGLNANGQYELKWSIDFYGCQSPRDTVVISRETPPTADFTIDASNDPTIAFNDASSVGSSFILNFDWNYGDSNTDNGPVVSHQFGSNTDYTVCLTISDGNGCTDDTCKTVTVAAFGVGIDTEELASFQVYPNPSQGIVSISGLGMFIGKPVVLNDMMGKLVFLKAIKSETETLDLSGLPIGVYTIQLGNRRSKIVLE